MLSAGELIWASSRPLIRLVLCVASGFILTKTDNFPAVASRGAGQIMLNICQPCLMFSKIVPAFTSDNINALGPLVLVAISYEAIGIAMAWIIKQFFWVPHRFRYGVLVAGGWGNVGDIPTSVIVSVTGAAPFNAATDQNLSVAYISVFILVFLLTLFPAGGHNWISMDYVGPDVEPEEVQEVVKRRRQAVLYAIPNAVARISGRPLRRRKRDETQKQNNNIASRGRFEEKARQEAEEPTDVEMSGNDPREGALGFSTATAAPLTSKHVSFYEDATTAVPTDGVRSPICSPTPTEAGYAISSPTPTTAGADAHKSILQTQEDVLPTTNQPAVAQKPSTDTSSTTQSGFSMRRLADPRVLRTFLSSLLSPPSIGILVSFPIALIPPLKGLFVPLPPSSSTSKFSNPHIPPAPDGLPPLSIILDTATFIGAAAVPLGLICLGAALARLNVARDQWRTLPTGAIGMLAVGKIIVAPILGVGIVTGLVNSGVISKEDKVLQFVCIFFSCLPTATTQVFLTQVYSGTGSAEHLSAFLIPQYILMFFSMTGLTAYALQHLF